MTSLPDRPNTAVVVVDVQNGVVEGAPRRDEVIANINTLIGRARAADVPVVWVQHQSEELPEGSDQWQYVPELQMGDGEPVVHKRYGDSFEDTTLEQELAAGSGGSSSPVPRPTPASGPPSTARSRGATTPPSWATPTPPRTSPSGAPRRSSR